MVPALKGLQFTRPLTGRNYSSRPAGWCIVSCHSGELVVSSCLLSMPCNMYVLLSGLRRPSLFLVRRCSFLKSLAFGPEDPSQELVAHASPCRSPRLLSCFVTLFYSSSSLLSARFCSCIIVSCRNRIDFRYITSVGGL